MSLHAAVQAVALCGHLLAGALAESLAQAAARLVQLDSGRLRQALQVCERKAARDT